jgi:hypothetical protein
MRAIRTEMPGSTSQTLVRRLGVCLLLAACGSGSDSPPPTHVTAIRTLAYVVTDCHEDTTGTSWSQKLEILRGDNAPVTVAEIPIYHVPPVDAPLCQLFGQYRIGSTSVLTQGFQRLGVSPDGSTVVFEVTFDFSLAALLGLDRPLPPEREGIFVVRADGRALRRLGPASRERCFNFITMPLSANWAPTFAFNPDGTVVTFVDRGIGEDGEDTAQITTLDITTGTRTQLTHLPSAPPPPADNPTFIATAGAVFRDAETIFFYSTSNPADPTGVLLRGLNPEGTTRAFSVNTHSKIVSVLPAPTVLGGGFTPDFSITGPSTSLLQIQVARMGAVGPPLQLGGRIFEVFVASGEDLLQLTNFGRAETFPGSFSTDRRRVFYIASANPVGENQSEDCQIFSVDTLGTDLHQVTHFRGADHSIRGCGSGLAPGCWIGVDVFGGPYQDPVTQALVFDSICDPLGANPDGEQFFAIRPDGSGLRQLTFTRGMRTGADGSVDVELPGPQAYSATSGAAF